MEREPLVEAEKLVDTLATDERLDPVVDRLTELSERAEERLSARTWRALEGVPLGHPLHPALVNLPIGFWTSAVLADFSRSKRAATLLTAAGVASAIPTMAAGLASWRRRDSVEERRVGAAHATANTAAFVLQTGSLWHRLRGRRVRGAALGMLGVAAAGAGGYLGGHLAYRLGDSSGGRVDRSPSDAEEAGIVDQQDAALAAAPPPARAAG